MIFNRNGDKSDGKAQNSEMAERRVPAGIPLVISRSAPLLGAVELADRYGLGVIGFLRGERFNLYSGRELIV